MGRGKRPRDCFARRLNSSDVSYRGVLVGLVGAAAVALPAIAIGATAAVALPAIDIGATVSATPAQKAAIIKAFGDPRAASSCLTVRLAASNHRYAIVRPRPATRCLMWAFKWCERSEACHGQPVEDRVRGQLVSLPAGAHPKASPTRSRHLPLTHDNATARVAWALARD
jgi:hypothetical protein